MKVTRAWLAVAVLALAGCASETDRAAVPDTATGSLEQLAAEVKCTPDIQVDTDDYRQALCKGDDEKYVLLTFATDRGQRDWINEAKPYGGHYLVGRKWIAVGDENMVTSLRGELGGDIEIGQDHTGDHHGG